MKLVPLTIDSPENLILASIFEEVFPPEERISIEDLYRPSQLDGYAVLGGLLSWRDHRFSCVFSAG